MLHNNTAHDKLKHVDVIPLVFLPLNLAQNVGYILSFVMFSCNTPRVYFSLQRGQQACNENVTTSDGHWQMESGYALCIYRWVDGWMIAEERNRVWIAEHCTSRCHESILSHSPAELNISTTSSPQVTPWLFTKYTEHQNNLQKYWTGVSALSIYVSFTCVLYKCWSLSTFSKINCSCRFKVQDCFH